MTIDRPIARARIHEAFSVHPAVALTGPRQCGKTTLARAIAAAGPEGNTFFDLERAVDRRRLQAPEQALTGLSGLEGFEPAEPTGQCRTAARPAGAQR